MRPFFWSSEQGVGVYKYKALPLGLGAPHTLKSEKSDNVKSV